MSHLCHTNQQTIFITTATCYSKCQRLLDLRTLPPVSVLLYSTRLRLASLSLKLPISLMSLFRLSNAFSRTTKREAIMKMNPNQGGHLDWMTELSITSKSPWRETDNKH